MAAVARRLLLKAAGTEIGERLLSSKLQILSGTGNRRPSIALSILTGRVAEQLSILDEVYATDTDADLETPRVALRPRLLARTVYLTESHLRDIQAIIEALQPDQGRRLTRSAILR